MLFETKLPFLLLKLLTLNIIYRTQSSLHCIPCYIGGLGIHRRKKKSCIYLDILFNFIMVLNAP